MFDWLQKKLEGAGIEEEAIETLIEDTKKEIPLHFVPKVEYNTVKADLKTAQTDLAKKNVAYESLEIKYNTLEHDKNAFAEKLEIAERSAQETIESYKQEQKLLGIVSERAVDAEDAITLFKMSGGELKLDGDALSKESETAFTEFLEKKPHMIKKEEAESSTTEQTKKEVRSTVIPPISSIAGGGLNKTEKNESVRERVARLGAESSERKGLRNGKDSKD